MFFNIVEIIEKKSTILLFLNFSTPTKKLNFVLFPILNKKQFS